MRNRCLPLTLVACLLAACAPTGPTAPAGAQNRPVATQPSTPGTALAHGGQVAYANQIPRQISLPLPAALLAAGGQIIAQGGGNYRLSAVDGTASPAAGAAKQPVSLAHALHDQMQIYANTTKLVNSILSGVTNAHLPINTSVTFPDNDNANLTAAQKKLPEYQITANLTATGDHALISIYRGSFVDATRQICAVRYTDQSHGTAVFRPLEADADGGKGTIATTFDLSAGKVSADAVFDGRGQTPAGDLWRVHWEFVKVAQAAVGTPTFTVRTSAYHHAAAAQNSGLFEISANCLGDTGAAGIVGVLPEAFKSALNGQLVFAHSDGSDPDPANAKPHDLYVDGANHDLSQAQAPAALKAVLPADSELYRPYMQDPLAAAGADPLAEAVFVFPR